MSHLVRVVDENWDGVAGVCVEWMLLDSPYRLAEPEYTDFDGIAKFSQADTGEIILFLNAVNYGVFRRETGRQITVAYV